MASGGNMNRYDAYVGTGSALAVSCGFQPRAVRVVNTNDGSRVEVNEFLASHATAGKRGGLKIVAAGDATFLAVAAGITLTASGFTVGTDAACNASGVSFYYEAID